MTNTDVVVLQEEEAELREKIAMLAAIIGDERTMYYLMKKNFVRSRDSLRHLV